MGIAILRTYCMTNDKEDFTGSVHPMNGKVLVVSDDQAKITQYGEDNFVIQDDEGIQCDILIHELY
jgi:hypothetical protein